MRKVDCLSCGVRVELVPWAEGKNHLTKKLRACGFRTYRAVELALYHNLRRLPEPDFTHRFC